MPQRALDPAIIQTNKITEHRRDLAAVMIEPAGPWGGDDIGFEPDADAQFLRDVAIATQEAGALLVFDEIVTGYRYRQGSVQKAPGVIPVGFDLQRRHAAQLCAR